MGRCHLEIEKEDGAMLKDFRNFIMRGNVLDMDGRPYRDRTCDTLIKSQVLYQLS